MKYTNVFIDLDRTLWDFEANSRETFQEIFLSYHLNNFCNFEDYYPYYRTINDNLWKEYREGKIGKELLSWKRFYLTNLHFGLDDKQIAQAMGEAYIILSPEKTGLFPYTHELLDYLKSKYRLFLITNGFKEVQYKKLTNCKLDHYFNAVFTSEEVGYNKPDRRYFEFVLAQTDSSPSNSIVIGDDQEVDIKGALSLSIDSIWINTNSEKSNIKSTFEVKNLKEIFPIL